jgi:DNA-binding CsgD family transcriptional regulator
MNEDARISLDKSGALPMEVRIFALMRLGIDDPAQVADYLHLSVNTIYVYKNKIKSKASVSKEHLMPW